MNIKFILGLSLLMAPVFQIHTMQHVERVVRPVLGLATVAALGGLVCHWNKGDWRLRLDNKHEIECVAMAALLAAVWSSYATVKLSNAGAHIKENETHAESIKRWAHKTGSYVTAATTLAATFTAGFTGWMLYNFYDFMHASKY